MDVYTGFAVVYDEYMDNIPYEEWSQYLISLLRQQGIGAGKTVVDLGCGTGTVTMILAANGYDCVGIDNAPEMLTIAADKMYAQGQEIVYSLQDMRDFALPYEADAMVSICDSMNYITGRGDLKKVFDCVKAGLAPGGVFIFDLKTIHFFRDILGGHTYAENRDTSAFVWNNSYDEHTRNNRYELAVFVQNADGAFTRYEEEHFQHGFENTEVLEAAKAAGLSVTAVYDAFTLKAPRKDSERLYYILRK